MAAARLVLVVLSVAVAVSAICCEQPACPGPCTSVVVRCAGRARCVAHGDMTRVQVTATTPMQPAKILGSCCGQPACADPCGSTSLSVVKPATNVVIDNAPAASCCGQPACADPCGGDVVIATRVATSCCGQVGCTDACGNRIVGTTTNVVIDNPTVVSCCGTVGCTDPCGATTPATTVVSAPSVCCGSPGCPQPCPGAARVVSCCGQPLCADPCAKGPVGRLARIVGNFTSAKAVGGSPKAGNAKRAQKRLNASKRLNRTRANGTRANKTFRTALQMTTAARRYVSPAHAAVAKLGSGLERTLRVCVCS
jgi:hypothetical protein